MKVAAKWMVVAALLAIYATALWAVLHPHVSHMFRAYYIDRVSSEWVPVRYTTTPEEGIEFARVGLPDWVDYTAGFSVRESWGRWSDADVAKKPTIMLTRPITGPVCAVFTARPSPPLVGKAFALRFGDEAKYVPFSTPDFATYRVDFDVTRGAERIEFIFPGELPPLKEFDSRTTDKRRLGIALVNLKFYPARCETLQQSR